ncbi:peroxisomal membrane protein 11A [Hemiscyllium ocellatum]|uniref:peroxisomal membrane protein 11A n=1 Tax=Hemiscyllium ocellatum TaxID=170820 RepID=UPI0029668273|nr:peroxisomal membrane protein 11A [Hemiscyllium ocellatum]
MDSFVKFTSLSQGRERIFRTIQYACMLLNYLIHKNDSNKELVSKLKQLESNMSSGRKLFRLGNTVDAVQAARRNIHLSDPILRFCLTIISLSRAVYFICDNVLWMGAVGLGGIDKEKWNKRCNHYYFFSLVISLSRDVYEITLLLREEALAQKGHQGKSINPLNANHVQRDFGWALTISSEDFFMLLYQSLKNNPPVLLDLIKNLCDLSLPLDKLGIFRINPGVVSLCGLISSVVSILTLTHPALKLRP